MMEEGEWRRLKCCADLTPNCASVQQSSLSLQSILLAVILCNSQTLTTVTTLKGNNS